MSSHHFHCIANKSLTLRTYFMHTMIALVSFLAECKDDPSAHKRCQKIVEELGQQICFVDIPQIKTKLRRSCAETCKLCPNKLRGM